MIDDTCLDRKWPEFIRRDTSNLQNICQYMVVRIDGKLRTAKAASCVNREATCHGWTWRRRMTLTLPSYFPPEPRRGFTTLSIVKDDFALCEPSNQFPLLVYACYAPEGTDIVHYMQAETFSRAATEYVSSTHGRTRAYEAHRVFQQLAGDVERVEEP